MLAFGDKVPDLKLLHPSIDGWLPPGGREFGGLPAAAAQAALRTDLQSLGDARRPALVVSRLARSKSPRARRQPLLLLYIRSLTVQQLAPAASASSAAPCGP